MRGAKMTAVVPAVDGDEPIGLTAEEAQELAALRTLSAHMAARPDHVLLQLRMNLAGGHSARVALNEEGCVVNLAAEGEAARAGVRVGDRIVKARVNDGKETLLAGSRQRIHGLLGSEPGAVIVTVLRRESGTAGREADDLFSDSFRGELASAHRACAVQTSTRGSR